MLKIILLSSAALVYSASASAAVSKWVDAQGKVHYSEQAPKHTQKVEQIPFKDTLKANANKATQPAEKLGDETDAKSTSETSATTNKIGKKIADGKKSAQEIEVEQHRNNAERAPSPEEQAHAASNAKQANCFLAQANVQALMRRSAAALDDAQRLQLIEAQRGVDNNCN